MIFKKMIIEFKCIYNCFLKKEICIFFFQKMFIFFFNYMNYFYKCYDYIIKICGIVYKYVYLSFKIFIYMYMVCVIFIYIECFV